MNNEVKQQLNELGIDAYLTQHQQKSLLRFLTCGSVDDGKSTLIGRLLHDTQQIYEDQLAAVHVDSQRVGTTGDRPDLALLVDGLQAEREQGITIDVAYRYFSTKKRKFIIADTPGHEQYTRNMATGASTCDVAIILIDARNGILDQTRRHSFIASLLGIKHFIVAVNKMDLVDYSQVRFDAIAEQYREFSNQLPTQVTTDILPLSALEGDNVVCASQSMSWYQGSTLLQLLESVDLKVNNDVTDLRFSVQYVNRPHLDFRGFAGTISSGLVTVGQRIKVLPSGVESQIKKIVTFDGELTQAYAGQAITLVLSDEIDVSRGDVMVCHDSALSAVTNVAANVVWMGAEPLQIGQQYDIKIAGKKTLAHLTGIQHRYDINALEPLSARELKLNEIGLCHWQLHESVVVDRYHEHKDTGGFIIIDRLSNVTVGAGLVMNTNTDNQSLKSDHIASEFEVELNQLICRHFPHWQALDISHDK